MKWISIPSPSLTLSLTPLYLIPLTASPPFLSLYAITIRGSDATDRLRKTPMLYVDALLRVTDVIASIRSSLLTSFTPGDAVARLCPLSITQLPCPPLPSVIVLSNKNASPILVIDHPVPRSLNFRPFFLSRPFHRLLSFPTPSLTRVRVRTFKPGAPIEGHHDSRGRAFYPIIPPSHPSFLSSHPTAICFFFFVCVCVRGVAQLVESLPF